MIEKSCLSEIGCLYRTITNHGAGCSHNGLCSYQRPDESCIIYKGENIDLMAINQKLDVIIEILKNK